MKTKIIIGVSALVVLVLGGVGLFFFLQRTGLAPEIVQQKIVVEEKLVVPDTVEISTTQARTVQKGAVEAPISTSKAEVVSEKAVLTLKGSYDKALVEASAWAPDAALVFIKSLGVVTGEGKSGEWQVVFGSKEKKAGFEVLVYGDAIAAKKEVPSTSYGYALPQNWYDSGDALLSLQTEPQFKDATVSSLNFFYNEDGKRWAYALATSNGTLSMPVK